MTAGLWFRHLDAPVGDQFASNGAACSSSVAGSEIKDAGKPGASVSYVLVCLGLVFGAINKMSANGWIFNVIGKKRWTRRLTRVSNKEGRMQCKVRRLVD
jgi:hypothetical protein